MTAQKLSNVSATEQDPIARGREFVAERKKGLPTALSEPDRRAMEAYQAWLFYERRLLCMELYPSLGVDAEKFVMAGNAGFGWHVPASSPVPWDQHPQPSTRAAAVLDLVGVNWRAYEEQDEPIADTGDRPALPAGWPHADAELLGLVEEWRAARATFREAADRWSDAWDRCAHPPRPRETLVWTFDYVRDFPRGELFQPYTSDQIEELRSKPRMRKAWGVTSGELLPDGRRVVPDPEAQKRADAIVAAWDRWQAETTAATAAVNLDELKQARDDALRALRAAETSIQNARARTLEGLAVKAEVCADLGYLEGSEIDDVIEGRLEPDVDDMTGRMMFSLVRDLLRFAKPAKPEA